jgi:hypothetical protein
MDPRYPCQASSSPPPRRRRLPSCASSSCLFPAWLTGPAVRRRHPHRQRLCGPPNTSMSARRPCHRACRQLTAAHTESGPRAPSILSLTSAAAQRWCRLTTSNHTWDRLRSQRLWPPAEVGRLSGSSGVSSSSRPQGWGGYCGGAWAAPSTQGIRQSLYSKICE